MYKVIAECVDDRTGRRYKAGENFDPPPSPAQAKRLQKAGCVEESDETLPVDKMSSDALIGELLEHGRAELVGRSRDELIAAVTAARRRAEDGDEGGLDTKTVAELRKYAEENGVELTAETTKKADIIAAIEKAKG